MPVQENNGIIDISLGISRQRIRVDGDDNKIVLLNTSDLNVVPRMEEAYPKLQALFDEAEKENNSENADSEETAKNNISDRLKRIDTKMKELVDYIFDSNISEVCLGNCSMFSPFKGVPMYEAIINGFSQLYSDTIESEMKKTQNRVKQHTAKYKNKK